jgi:hypothetical protein
MASPEKKTANFRFPCGHKVGQQTGNRIDSTRVDEKINFDFRGDPSEGRNLKFPNHFRTLEKHMKIVTFLFENETGARCVTACALLPEGWMTR